MILQDSITIVWADGREQQVRAHVGAASYAILNGKGNSLATQDKVQAIIDPISGLKNLQTVRWRGDDYLIDGLPLVRRRGPRDHHMTLTIRRTIDT